jgi:hypothetical protein
MESSYSKDSKVFELIKTGNIGQLKISSAQRKRNKFSFNFKNLTIKRPSLNGRTQKTPWEMLDDFPNHKKNTAVANSYRYSTCGRSIFNQRNNKTISVKDLLTRELMSTKSHKAGGSVLPRIIRSDSKNKVKRPSTISSVFTLSSVAGLYV